MQPYVLKLSRIKNARILPSSNYSVVADLVKSKTTDEDDLLHPRIKNIKDKLLYSDYIERKKLRLGHTNNIIMKKRLEYKFGKEKESIERITPVMSIALKYLSDDNENSNTKEDNQESDEIYKEEASIVKPIHMPYAATDKYQEAPAKPFKHKIEEVTPILNEKYKKLYEKYLEAKSCQDDNTFEDLKMNLRLGDDLTNVSPTWLTDYEIYDDALQEDLQNVTYGTPDSNTEVSSVPCGGCGALLHCKDVAIPGYLPSELFIKKSESDLKSIICQRCHFMKYYNTCLDVKVSADEYPKLLEKIKYNPKAAVILLVDLTDFPCSIWPDLPSVIGVNRHVYVIGNKIDLLPPDSPNFYEHVKHSLRESLIVTGIAKTNIKHVDLISAKTGFGIERLINKLHKKWDYRSDVFLVGCTNAGKSTLFNILLQSDFCKSQAVDLVQRATTSPWPGTTLNLLKFPILKPSPQRLFLRVQRLQNERKIVVTENQIRQIQARQNNKIELAAFQSRINHTYKEFYDMNTAAAKVKNEESIVLDKAKKIGLDETSSEYQNSRWCYDTPGTIQPDQILHFMTTDELMKILPQKMISPRTFCIWAGQSIFIAGLGRLDILSSSNYIRCTVFASKDLPVTICQTKDAELIYNELLQTEAFGVPINNPDRLKMWPELKSKDLETVGIGDKESVSDVVLSSAGWIAITGSENDFIAMRAWTPEARGIYLRTPAVLKKSVTLRGMRKVGSPAYRLGRQIYISKKVH